MVEVVKANNTLEKATTNLGGLLGGGAVGLLGGFDKLVGAVGENMGKVVGAMEEEDVEGVTSDEAMLDEMRINTRNQTALLGTLGAVLGVNKLQLGAAEETVDLLPSVGALR